MTTLRKIGFGQVMLGICISIFLVGCSDIEAPQVGAVPPNEIMSQVRISTNSVVMQIGDSLQLSVTATSAAGTDLDITRADYITWSSSNGDVVRIDSSSGLIRGIDTTAGVSVNVSVTMKYAMVTKRHTIPVYVTTDRIEVSEVKLIALDSSRVPYGDGNTVGVSGTGLTPPRIRLEAYDNGMPVTVSNALTLDAPTGARFTFDRDAQVYLVTAGSRNIGKFMVRLSGNLYGNEVSDSLEFESIYKPSYLLPNFDFSWEWVEDPQSVWGHVQIADSVWILSGFWEPSRAVLQKCAVIVVVGTQLDAVTEDLRPGFRYPPLDIVFDDSASISDCESSPDIDTSRFEQALGGNIYNWSRHDKGVIRKSSTVGEVKWHIRDAVTKEVLINGRYVVKDSEN